jgi:predicted secreted protein
MKMATLVGNDGQVTIAGNAVVSTRNFTVDITSDTIETTTMGVDARTYVKGMSTWSGSADIYFNTSDYINTVLPAGSSAAIGSAPATVKFYLLQDAANSADTALCGNCIITGYSVKSSMDGLVEATISIQGSGPVLYQTGNVVVS